MKEELKNRLISMVKDIYDVDNVGLGFDLDLAKRLGYTDREIKIAGLMLSSIPNWCDEVEEILNVLYNFEKTPRVTIAYYIHLIDIVVVINRTNATCQFYNKKELDQKVKEKRLKKY